MTRRRRSPRFALAAEQISSTTELRAAKSDTPSTPPPRKRPRKTVVTPSPQASLDATNVTPTRATNGEYQDLKVPAAELRPSATLTTGQCFHWRALPSNNADESPPTSAWGSHNATEWVGILRESSEGRSIVVALQETPATTLYRTLYAPENLNVEDFLRAYFQLHRPLVPLYQEWSEADPKRLSQIAKCIPGVRIVDQDPWECLVSFICSSNNNIPRITKMLWALRSTYGNPLVTLDDGTTLYSFPSLETLSKSATDADLRTVCGLGYRARYLLETMETLTSLGGEAYLQELRAIKDPVQVQDQLVKHFCGVGRKVADCVALFSLQQQDAIPVDVHVWNIARRDYDSQGVFGDVKSLTPAVYRQVGDVFRSRFPTCCGWAHSLLFVAELPSFRPVLPEALVDEMDKFREEEQAKKKAAKESKRQKGEK